ncbi:MAG: flavodoxin-dependent (E)-4-hydroxy-3-methylbut-2-enyl-diphosphate synthase [Acidobacteriota bacterium]|nr:flavodoxin-dependent (E)-4-hydroxy-3-methylbut-2-enyl-diphosphate synthase [Blastocatellia bacterium]MDW8411832.1 flavodoxin-dependent (E)-4-hydroxy-3-methylbut-2-enyl-diphosphate synthase [Acidobacteriota bacterium]
MFPNTRRRKSVQVDVGGVKIGGDAPIVVQSMTNTDTCDVKATADQIETLYKAGSSIVRITVNTKEAAAAVPDIYEELYKRGLTVPIVGDFHYNGHILLTEYKECARLLAKYRINPGNVGFGKWHDKNFLMMIDAALEHNKPVRIGVNWGSLDQRLLTRLMDENRDSGKSSDEIVLDAMVISAIESAEQAEAHGLPSNKIILSAKVSEIDKLVRVYRSLAEKTEYALHLGLTEAGLGTAGIIKSAIGIGILLHEGIGDTIRVSLTPRPGGRREEEVEVAKEILQAMGLSAYGFEVTACPGCGRTTSEEFQILAAKLSDYVKSLKVKNRLKIAVMGCVVNGPGESKYSDIGVSLPGTGEGDKCVVFFKGKKYKTVPVKEVEAVVKSLVESVVEI